MLLPWPIMTGTAAAPQSLAYFDSETSVLGARGGDRVSWLNGLVTCDVSKLAAGAAMPGLLVEKKGKITAEVMVADHEGALAIVVTAGRGPKVHEVFEHHLIMEDVELDQPNGDDGEADDDGAGDQMEAEVLGEAAGGHLISAGRLRG